MVDHEAVIRELAETMFAWNNTGSVSYVSARWHGHDGAVDNTELHNAREALGDEHCARVYAARMAELRNQYGT